MTLRDQIGLAFCAATLLLASATLPIHAQIVGEETAPSIVQHIAPASLLATPPAQRPGKPAAPDIAGAPPLGTTFAGFNFDGSGSGNGFLFIPPDPNGAAGPTNVVNVGNVTIQWFSKVGAMQSTQSLQTFFAPLGPPLGTFTFDPKVIYDQYNQRFVVVTLEKTDTARGDPADDSYILIAVSKTPDPNGGWWFGAIHSKMTIGGKATWADYPGFAVDGQAIYVTTNMFAFAAGSGTYQGERVWIINKAPLYAGGAITATAYDAYGAAGVAGFATTAQPAHMFGTPPAGVGTYLCAYSGLTNGGPGASEFVQVIEVADPLGGSGGPFFTSQFVPCGDIEDVGGAFGFPALPGAPQSGTTQLVAAGDRRTLNAVWRNGSLYISTTIIPNAGIDAGQTTAHWWRLNTTPGIGSIATADQGNAGAEDLGTDTYTFYPSVAVDNCDDMAIGFAASNTLFFPGAYYTGRLSTDPAGTLQSTGTLMAGTDYYYRAFGGPRNRWGDYSGIALDPADGATFWVYNEYAMMRGTVLSSLPGEDGRWATQWGSFVIGCQPVPVAVQSFNARTVQNGVELTASFTETPGSFQVDLYRAEGDATATSFRTVTMNGVDDLHYVDNGVQPGHTYNYFIVTKATDGDFRSPNVTVAIPGVATALAQNSPNPFNPATTIAFDLAVTQRVRITIYDGSGRPVRTLVDGVRDAGSNKVEWNGRDNAGNAVASGVYFYRLFAGTTQLTRKMVLLK